MKIYVTGVSGVGKTSLAEAFAARGVKSLDLDEISHWEHKTSKEVVDWAPGMSDEWHATHQWICHVSTLEKKLREAEDVIVTGNSSNQSEFLHLFDRLFVIHCSLETVLARIDARTNNDYGKHEQERKHLREWQKVYDDKMVAKGAVLLDGEKPLEELVAEIRTLTNIV